MNYFAPDACPSARAGAWQVWRQTYPLNKAFAQGTIFPELDLNFNYRRYQQ